MAVGTTEDYTSLSAVKALADIDAELAEILKTYNPPKRDPDVEARRAAALQLNQQRAAAARNPAVHEFTKEIPMSDGYMNEIRVFAAKNKKSCDSPLIILYSGGGFITSSNKQLAPYATFFAIFFSAVVVLATHRLAPENPFPAAPNDAWDTFSWVASNAASLGANPTVGFVLGGFSTGGNLAAVVAQKSVTENFSPKLTGVWLSMPPLLSHSIVPEAEKHLFISREQNADTPHYKTKNVEMTMRNYNPEETSPLFSPFNAEDPHRGLPSTYIQVCGWDPFRDDGLIYARALQNAGVKTALDVYPGVPHAHVTFFPTLKSSGKFHLDAVTGVGRLLGKEVDRESISKIVAGIAMKVGKSESVTPKLT